MTLSTLLLIVALLLFLGAAVSWPRQSRVNLGWLGLAVLVLAALMGAHTVI